MFVIALRIPFRVWPLGAALVCLMVSPIAAQNAAQPAAPAAQATDTSGFERVVLTAGRSTVLNTPFDVTRIAVTNPAVADAVVVQPREVLIDGKSAGTVSLIVWGAQTSGVSTTSWSIPA